MSYGFAVYSSDQPLLDAPVGVDDAGSATENQSRSFAVLVNDSDDDTTNGLLRIQSLGSVTASGPGGSFTLPAGIFTIATTGRTISFSPGSAFDFLSAGQVATLTVVYTVVDPSGGTGQATLTVSVTGQAERFVMAPEGGFLTTTSFQDSITGSATDDTINALGGNDTINAGTGDNLVYAGGGDDVVVVGMGDNHVDGGSGNDMITAAGGDDVLGGGSGDDVIAGGAGDDEIHGGSGADHVAGGAGGDVLVGGSGFDTLDYSQSRSGVTLSLVVGSIGVGGDAQDDVASGFEAITGSAFADRLDGNALANRLEGGGGSDRLAGAAGDDILDGGASNDVLLGGAGADTLIGGSGIDTADFSVGGTTGVTVDLAQHTNSGGAAAGDTLSGIENLVGSLFADHLTGDGAANRLDGNAGDDVLQGGGASDVLNGGDGNDILDGGAGADTMSGGAGADQFWVDDPGDRVLTFDASDTVFASISYTLPGRDGNLTLVGTAAIDGTGGSGMNTIVGNDGANHLKGLAGYDRLFGGAGDDIIEGGTSLDMLSGGSGNDVFVFNALDATAKRLSGLESISDFLSIGRNGYAPGAEFDQINLAISSGGGDFSYYERTVGGQGFNADNVALLEAARIARDPSLGNPQVIFLAGVDDGWVFWDSTPNDGKHQINQGIKLIGLNSLSKFDASDII